MISLNEKLAELGLSLGGLIKDFPAVCLVGSRAASCAREDSDWDLVVFFENTPSSNLELLPKRGKTLKALYKNVKCSQTDYGYGLRRRINGLDLMFEDINCLNWTKRELCTHISGYGVWLSGKKHWHDSNIDWPGAVELKKKILVERTSYLTKAQLAQEAQRMWCLEHKVFVPPTALLNDIVPRTNPVPKAASFKDIDEGKPISAKPNPLSNATEYLRAMGIILDNHDDLLPF